MMIAALAQYGLFPMALSTNATHDGPEPSVIPAWSDGPPLGITQLRLASCPLAISVSTCVISAAFSALHAEPMPRTKKDAVF